jgi:UDP-GlcNAc:undecaprenyl-phosphate/decaprenyl-phosphate GlcNAc-1-phosphate transferase
LMYEPDLRQYFLSRGWLGFSFLLGGLAVAALGLYDDLRGANAWQKFAVQFSVAILLYFCGYRIDRISFPGGALELGIAALPITVVWIVGIINAMNLIDGIDGLAGGVALFAVVTNLTVSMLHGQPIMTLCMAAVAGALIGFLFYNFNPASIFLGDTGSLFLGYVLAVSSLRTHQKSSAAVSLFVPIVALALPIADTVLAMGRRAISGRSMFSGDREHIHHRLLRLGFTQRQVVGILYATSLMFGALALALTFVPTPAIGWMSVAVAVGALFGLRRLGFFRLAAGVLRTRHRNLELRSAVDRIAATMRRATSVVDVVESTMPFASAVSAQRIRLELEPTQFQFAETVLGAVSRPSLAPAANDPPPMMNGSFVARFELPQSLGRFELEWHDGRAELDRDHEVAAQVLCGHIAQALRRVAPRVQRVGSSGRTIWAPIELAIGALPLLRISLRK